MKQNEKLLKLDYRNACYQGYSRNDMFHDIGCFLTEDFLFCLSIWQQGNLNGPCFTILPSQKIFYGDFINNNPEGLFCYQVSKQCHIYCIYEKGKMRNHLIAIFPIIDCVLDLVIDENGKIESQKEYDYVTSEQKWNIFERLLSLKLPNYVKGFNNFIAQSFISHFKQIQQVKGSEKENFIGFVGEGLGFKYIQQTKQICQIGFYDQGNILKHMGKKIISKQKKVREQGIYNQPQTLVRYQQRPPIIKKTFRNFLRLSMNFQNKFLQIPIIQKMQKQFEKLKITIKQSTTQRIAQQLIQHLDQPIRLQQTNQPDMSQQYSRISPQTKRSAINDRYNPYRKMEDVSMDQIKQQINRSNSHRKSRGLSPYRAPVIPEPAELKYTSRSGRRVQPNLNKTTNPSSFVSHLPEDSYHYDRKYPHREITKEIDNSFSKLIHDENKHNQNRYPQTRYHQNRYNQSRYNPDQYKIPQQRKYYPIQDNLKLINNKQISRSPIRTQKRSPRYIKYIDQVNPERSDKFPYKIHSNIDPNRPISPTGSGRDYQPRSKQRINKLSNMYDEIQDKKLNQNKNDNRSTRLNDYSYPLNKGRGYRFDQSKAEDQILGNTKPMRTVQGYRNTRSPYRQPQSLYDDREIDRMYDRNLRKKNFGYFDRNM